MSRSDDRQKQDESAELRDFIWSLGEDPDAWRIQPGERPDFRAIRPSGGPVGIELTSILEQDQGRDQSQEVRITNALLTGIEPHVRAFGGTGARVHDRLDRLPERTDDLRLFTVAFRQFLDAQGDALAKDGGTIETVWRHPFGLVEHVNRCDGMGFEVHGNHIPLPHKAERSLVTIEDAVAAAVREKARKATSYDRSAPLWLVIRNPNQPVDLVSDTVRAAVQAANGGNFARVFLHNLQLDTYPGGTRRPGSIDLTR